MLAYGVLAATVIFAFAPAVRSKKPVQVILVSAAVALIYGILDEFHQSFIPERTPSVGDVAADFLGALLVCGLWYYLVRRRSSTG